MRQFSPFALVLFALQQCSAQACTPSSLAVANSDFNSDISSWTPSGFGGVTWITSPLLVSGASAGQAQLTIPAMPNAFVGVAQLGLGSATTGSPISVSGWVRFDTNTSMETLATCHIAISNDADYKLFVPTAVGWQQYAFTSVSDGKSEAANIGVTCNASVEVTAFVDLVEFKICPDGSSTSSTSSSIMEGGTSSSAAILSITAMPTSIPSTFYGNGTTALPTSGQIVSEVITYIYVDLCGCKEGTKKYTTTTTIVYPHCGCTDMKPPKVPVTTTTAVYELSGAPATATLTLPIKGPDAPTNENGGGAAAAATGGGPGGNPAGGAGGPTRWSSPGSTSTTTPMQVMKGVSMRVSVSGVWAGVGFMMSAYLLL